MCVGFVFAAPINVYVLLLIFKGYENSKLSSSTVLCMQKEIGNLNGRLKVLVL